MIFDNERQKGIVLQLIEVSSIPGKAIDELYEFKKKVETAEIKEKTQKKEKAD